MSSNSTRIVFNSLERLLSTDFETGTALQDANLDNGVAAAAAGVAGSGDGFGAGQQASGVVDGLIPYPTAPGVNLIVGIGPGLAYKVGTAPTAWDSRMRRIEVKPADVLTVDLAPYVDGANPRWVCIQIAPGSATLVSELRDVFQPALGTFTSVAVDKIRGPAPVLSVEAGTAAAKPAFPDGVTGVIPLAYVYLPAAATSITANSFVFCRPLYSNLRPDVRIQGGGVTVTTAGTSVVPGIQRGSWFRGGSYATSGLSTWDLSATSSYWADTESFATLAGSNAAVYLYVCRPPYPGGFDAVVAREGINQTTVIDGWKGGEPLVVATTGAPNAAGPSGGRALTLQGPVWGSGGSMGSSGVHLLGVVSYLGSPAKLVPQVVHGDHVLFNASAANIDYLLVSAAANGATTQANFDPRTPAGSVGTTTPLRTTQWQVWVNCDTSATTVIADYRLLDSTRAAATVGPVWQDHIETPAAAVTYELADVATIYWDGGAQPTARVVETSGTGLGNIDVYLRGYLDPVLAAR